jgi:hypothetical protein
MLISMPTGTSTIFGVFQAICSSPSQGGGTTFAPRTNLMHLEKFASDYFAITCKVFVLQCKIKLLIECRVED